MYYTFKTYAELKNVVDVIGGAPACYIVLEEPKILTCRDLNNNAYTEEVKQFLTFDKDGDPTAWQTTDEMITYRTKGDELAGLVVRGYRLPACILTRGTYAEYLKEKEETDANALKSKLLKQQKEAEALIILKNKMNYTDKPD